MRTLRVIYWARLQLAKQQVLAALQSVEGVELVVVEKLPECLAALKSADALILYDAPGEQARPLTEALSAPGNTVRWMHFLTAGREGFDECGLPPKVTVTWPAGCVAPTVAEHAMALLLALVRGVPAMLEHQAKRHWSRIDVSAKATSVEGRTMAIVGYGQIGRELARRARPFGIRTIGVSRTVRHDEALDEGRALADLDNVLPRADIVAIALPLTRATHHLFDRRRLALCKPGVILINVARGGLVDQQALAEALASGHVGAAGIDVVDPEPLPADDPLWNAPNLLLSPHFGGGASAVSQARLAASAADNLRRLLAGQPLQHIVTG